MILLDTCALIWLNDDRDKFSKSTLAILERNQDALAVSPISFLEIGIKSKKKQFKIPGSLQEWSGKMVERYGLTSIPVSHRIAVKASELPDIHKDPFDRIIIATAAINKLRVVTADTVFPLYEAINVVW